MEYHEAVNTLERLRRLRPKLGTETTASLLEHLGDPHEGTPAVQVAGSNGKGSTARPTVAETSLDAGADVVTDATGLADVGTRRLVADRGVPVVLSLPIADVPTGSRGIEDVLETLTERLLLAERAGIGRSRVVVDPGLGVGVGPSGTPGLLNRLPEFRALGCPVLAGAFPDGTGDDGGSASRVAAAALAADRGADVLRVHDVEAGVAAAATAERATEGE